MGNKQSGSDTAPANQQHGHGEGEGEKRLGKGAVEVKGMVNLPHANTLNSIRSLHCQGEMAENTEETLLLKNLKE